MEQREILKSKLKIVSEEEFRENKARLEEQLNCACELDTKNYSSLKINWDPELSSWEEAKNKTHEGIMDGGNSENRRLFLIGHTKDTIEGKPQLISQTIQRIPLLRKIQRGRSGGSIQTSLKFFDDKYDRRYDGNEIEALAFDFWVYRIIDHEREYFVFSDKVLPEEVCTLQGMKINMDDTSEFSSTLKVKKIAFIFIAYDFDSKIKTLEPEELVKLTKENEWDEELFHNYLFLHPDGNIYDYTPDSNLLRKAQILSGKYEGYPLHLFEMGPVGTGKSTAAEAIDLKFREDQGINEAGNSTLKTLIPSFKEKPANLGYIVKCGRAAIIDEMMKMVESSLTHETSRISNYLGQMNMLLEQKRRNVGSGNDNSTIVKATAKVFIKTNPIGNKSTIGAHVGVIDPTFLSRLLIWVQDDDEISKIYNKEGVKEFPPHRANPPRQSYGGVGGTSREILKGENGCVLKACVGEGGIFRDDFLTIFDSCQVFLVDFNIDRCKSEFQKIVRLIQGPMQQVWRARGLHHTILLLDGIVKHRCLFIDYDPSFKPIEKDYDNLERLLIHMVQGWKTDMSIKDYSSGTL